MAHIYCPICGDMDWNDELEDDIIDPHSDCLEEYIRIEVERKEKMDKKEKIERDIEDDLIHDCEVFFNGGKIIS